jgi:hypothetical protein
MNSTQPSRNPLNRFSKTLRDIRDRHLERHRPTGFGFAFGDRIDYLDGEKWDQVTNCQTVFLRRSVLRVIEEHGPVNIRPRYAMVFRSHQPVAVVAVQIVGVSGRHFGREEKVGRANPSENLLKRALSPAAKLATVKWRERILVAGNLLSWGFHGIAFAAGEGVAELWPAVAEALYRIRRSENLLGTANFVMLKDMTPEQTGVDALRRFSYRPLETEPNMVLEIKPGWQSYEDYLGALTAPYRRNCKEVVKKLTAAGCTVETIRDLSPYAKRIHELYLAVHGNASVRLVTLPDSYLPALARTAGDHFRCTIIRRGEEILGFVTSIRDGDTAIGYYIGFDRAAAASGLPIYLRLLHASIDDAIHWRCKRLSLGRTALEPKAALGAKPEKTTVWLRHRVPALNWMMRGVLGAVPHEEAPERNPFKFVEANE